MILPAMKPSVSLITRHNVIVHRGQRLVTRSPHLMRFVGYLWWKRSQHPGAAWVGPDELVRVIDKPSPKQMQRYVDTLESARVPLVEYRSKTRGAWRLALHPRQVALDREGDELLAWLDFDPVRMQVAEKPSQMEDIAKNLRQALQTDALYAEQGIEDDEIENALAAYRALYSLPGTSAPLKASLIQRVCQLHRQRNDFAAWERELAELENLLSGGELGGADFATRLRLQRMFLRYDEGKRQEAYHILERINPNEIRDAFTLGRYYNAMGLAALHRLKETCQETENCAAAAKCALHDGLGHFSQALGYALSVNDHAGLESICFNIGNALFRCVRQAPERDDGRRLREAASWIGLCEMVCHRFGVGGSAQWSKLVMADMALQAGWGFGTINEFVGGVYASLGSLENLLQSCLNSAVTRANRLEQAEACRLLARLHNQKKDVVRVGWYREEAIAIYRELGRDDKIASLIDETTGAMPTEK